MKRKGMFGKEKFIEKGPVSWIKGVRGGICDQDTCVDVSKNKKK